MKKLLLIICGIYSMNAYSQGKTLPEISLEITYSPKEQDLTAIEEGLSEFNGPFFGHHKGTDFAVLLKDEMGTTVGGIIAWILPGIHLLCIDTFWIAEPLRNQGHGTRLLLAAEEEGKKQGCTHSQLETLPFQAEPFYQKLGYTRFAVIEKMYGPHDAIYLRKDLTQKQSNEF